MPEKPKPQPTADSIAAKSKTRDGLLDMVLASLLFSLMNTGVYAISLFDAGLPPPVVSFIRVLANMVLLLVPAMFRGRSRELFGDCRYSLWLRGLFGTLALMLSFAAITRIGPGESAFLTASSGVFVAMLGPMILSQRNTLAAWLAILGSFCGVSLLFDFRDSHNLAGQGMALLSGLLSALAYLMVAKAGRSNPPATVIFYFCLVALIVHVWYFSLFGYRLPANPESWAILAIIGVLGSGAQFFMTRAYQTAPAALVSSIGYLAPVLSLAWGIGLFGQIPGQLALFGALLILLFGVLLPFLR